jgi:AAA+ ATPase superfamily predicted ATPase
MFIVGISFEMLLGIITPGMVIAIHDGMITSMSRARTTRNPFFFGDLALDEAFTDRDEELASLEQDMLNGQNVALIAPRRYGKSSLVRRASQRLVAGGVRVAEVDLMKTPTKERLASHLARAIHDDIASTTTKAREGVLKAFGSLRVRPVMTYDPLDATMSFSFAARQADEDIDDTLERLLELPALLAAEQHSTVVLYFDEFQQITEIDPHLPALMRAIFQEQPDISHVYAGSKRDMMDRLFNHENEPFYRSAKVMELGAIPADAFGRFVEERFDGTDRGVGDEVVRQLLAITGGHPNATQELAHALWDQVPSGHSALPGDLDRALEAVLRSENARFTFVWEHMARAQRLLLQALTAEPGHVQSARYIDAHELPSAPTVQKAARALVGAEFIARLPDGRYGIVEPFLAEWIARYAQ